MLSVTITEKDGPSTTTSFDKTEVLIGRVKGNDIVLPKSNVSKRHSRIVVKDGKIILIDLKSTNGTFINGRRIAGPHVMQEGDKVFIGDYTIEVREFGGAAAGPAAMGTANGVPSPGPLPSLGSAPNDTHFLPHGPSPSLPQPPGFPRPSLTGMPSLGGPGGPGSLGGPTLTNMPSIPSSPGGAGPLPAGPLPAGPLPAGPLPAGPLPAGPLPAGPLPAGPLPAGPLPAGPLPQGPSLSQPLLNAGPGLNPPSIPSLSPAPAPAPIEEEPEDEEPLLEMPQPPGLAQGGPNHPQPLMPKPVEDLGPSLPGSRPTHAGGLPGAGSMSAPSLPPGPSSITSMPAGPASMGSSMGLHPNNAPAPAPGSVSVPLASVSNRPVNGNSSVNSHLNAPAEGVIDKSLRHASPAASSLPAAMSSAAEREISAAALPEEIVVDDARTMDTDAWIKAARIVMDKYLNDNDFQNVLNQVYPPEAESQNSCYHELSRCLNECRGSLGNVDCNSVLDFLLKEACGLGAIDTLIDDADVTSFIVYNFQTIVVDRKGRREISSLQFTSNDTLYLATQRLFQFQGINPQTAPAVSEIRFGDGTQIEIILPPVSVASTTIVVRKVNHDFLPLSALVQREMLSSEMERFLRLCVKAKRNILIVGAQGSGRTWLLNALGTEIPIGERIVTVENSASLKLSRLYVMNLEAQNASIPEGDLASLIRQTAHLRAERVLVDTLRLPEEAIAFASAICGGAQGSMATLCSINADDGFRMFGRMLATSPNARYLLGNIDIVVGIRAFTDARRRVVEISEVVPLEDGSCRLAPIFVWTRNGMGNQALGDGQFRASGNIPRFYRELERGGMALDSSIFNS